MNSPNHIPKYDFVPFNGNAPNIPNPIAINSVSSSNTNMKMLDQNILSPATPKQPTEAVEEIANANVIGRITKDSTPVQLTQWLNNYRLGQHATTFASFSGSDLLRMSKDDLVQICGLADGIRLYNTLHTKYVFHLCVSIDCVHQYLILKVFSPPNLITEPLHRVSPYTLASMVAPFMQSICMPTLPRNWCRKCSHCPDSPTIYKTEIIMTPICFRLVGVSYALAHSRYHDIILWYLQHC